MANKRDTSQQKRAKQNRAQRAALAARTEGGPPKRPSRVAPSTAEKLASKKVAAETVGAAGSSATGGKPATTRSGKPRRERPPRPGDTPVDIDTLEGGWYTKVQQVPGGAQVIMATLMTGVVTLMLLFINLYPSKEAQAAYDKAKDAGLKPDRPKATQTILEAQGTKLGLLTLAIPAVAVALALFFALKPQRRRVWLLAAIVVGLTVATQQPFYMVVVGFLGYAVYKAYKVEGPQESLLRRRRSQVSESDLDASGSEEDGGPA